MKRKVREFLRISVLGRGDVPMEIRRTAKRLLDEDAEDQRLRDSLPAVEQPTTSS